MYNFSKKLQGEKCMVSIVHVLLIELMPVLDRIQ